MANLTIIARIEAEKDKIDLVKSELLRLIEPTLKETGCMQYDLHHDNENAALFLFYESWKNRDLWQEHMNTVHLADFLKATEGAIAKFTVNEMTKI